MKRILLSVAVVLAFLPMQARVFSVGNDDFRAGLHFRDHRFTGASFTDLRTGEELGVADAVPLFELCIDGRLVTSADPVWDFAGRTTRTLDNGGTVVCFLFRGRGWLKGLSLAWDREVFPRDGFVRERLRLQSDGTHRLSCLEGANHLVFPRYTFRSAGPVRGRELRIGTFRKKREFPEHHMFHPDSTLFELGVEEQAVKGPFLILSDPRCRLVTSYEHASQDNAFTQKSLPDPAPGGNDGSQGVDGDVRSLSDDDFWFIAGFASHSDGRLVVGNRIRHGGYLDGELIPSEGWYETVWSTLSILPPDGDADAAIADYLLNKISENAASREADFYYNTWGFQRSSKDLYSVMTEERLREEIRYAHECGVQTFVIDDGWHETFGHWVCNPVRIPSGLRSLTAYMDSLGMRPGIWLSLPGAGPKTQLTLEHPEWIIRDAGGAPVLAQWKNPVYDLVGPYYDCLLAELKALCDEGFRFFKWDAMNTLDSTLPDLYHGDSRYSPRERADRYNYLLPFYVTRLMRELREYCPGTVVELDLTEPERCLIGLQVLQEGKYYFINNGTSKYNDYTSYRTRSVRTVINRYASFIPQELFTYAVYPHDLASCGEYNVTTALTAGHGIWGDLSLMTPSERADVKGLFDKASQVLPFVRGARVEVVGEVGDTPEIYVQRCFETGWALVTAFGTGGASSVSSVSDASVSAGAGYPFTVGLRTSEVLGVLGHPYRLGPEGVELKFSFEGPADCASAFVLGGKGSGPQVYSSTGRLESIVSDGPGIRICAATDSEVSVGMPDGRLVTRFIAAGAVAVLE